MTSWDIYTFLICFGRYIPFILPKRVYIDQNKKVIYRPRRIDGPRSTSRTKLYNTELWPLSTLENLLCKLEKVVTCAEILRIKLSKQCAKQMRLTLLDSREILTSCDLSSIVERICPLG